jgi:hypothetical protein
MATLQKVGYQGRLADSGRYRRCPQVSSRPKADIANGCFRAAIFELRFDLSYSPCRVRLWSIFTPEECFNIVTAFERML